MIKPIHLAVLLAMGISSALQAQDDVHGRTNAAVAMEGESGHHDHHDHGHEHHQEAEANFDFKGMDFGEEHHDDHAGEHENDSHDDYQDKHAHDDHESHTDHEHDDHEDEHGHDSLDSHQDKHAHDEEDGHNHGSHDSLDDDHESHVDHKDKHGHDSHDSHQDEHAHGDDVHGHEHDDHESHSDHEEHDDHGHDDHGHGVEADHAELSNQQKAYAGIETIIVTKQRLPELITAPGEVVVNSYRTTAVTPRVSAQVIKRHVRLGDHVKKGQALLTLSSVEMAEAQGALLEAEIERARVNKLGRKVVSEKRFIAAQIAYQKAHSQVSAYGMTNRQIDKLVKEGDAAKANGQFQLLSFQEGTIISDDFVIGQIVEPGDLLMQVTDESKLWVEARLPAGSAEAINVNADANVTLGGSNIAGKVVQIHHLLDETTRTQAVYVEVNNPNHQLHPGQFVSVSIDSAHIGEGIAVPTEAVLRNNKGEWRVFVETEPGRFEPQVVNFLSSRGDQVVIEGVEESTRIVGRGAFFVQSEMAKAAFDTHNH